MKRILYTFLLAVIALAVRGQQISVSAPRHAAVGEEFQIEYTFNTTSIRNFRLGGLPRGLNLVYGPSTSRQSSFQIDLGGHTRSSSSMTFTYVLVATKRGSYKIPPARFTMNGQNLASTPIHINISEGARQASTAGSYGYSDDDDAPRGAVTGGKDLFIRVTASKNRVHEQEPILLTYKVYTTLELTQLDGKMPDLTGFHTQQVKLSTPRTAHIERVNGRPYNCVTWSQYVMYPQMTGKLTIPSITFHGIVMEENRNMNPFEAFIYDGGYKAVKRNIVAPALTITVDPLPHKPADFSGGVGHFNISAQVDKNTVREGDPINLRVVVGGIGNLKLIQQPQVQLPKEFDKYDAKITDKTQLTANGVEGNMIYDIPLVPRKEGYYTIPPIRFTYYDTQSNSYKTLQTQPFRINVAKGDGSVDDDDEVSLVDQDIHPIMKGDKGMSPFNGFFFGSVSYWTILALLILAFILILRIMGKRVSARADVTGRRSRNANRVASKRLHQANLLMIKGQKDEFFDEVLKALWGYVSDKLNIPSEQLTRENISDQLAANQVDQDTIKQFITALDECEYDRYAPGDVQGNMNKTFEMAMQAIMHIENAFANGKSGASKVHAVILVLLLLMPASAMAITKQNADAEYLRGNYTQAIADYQELLHKNKTVALYYNLGNAYYRVDNITQAVLAYERAYELDPGNSDIRFNLEKARSKTIDKITPQPEMFFVTWYRALVYFISIDSWAFVAIVAVLLAIVSLLFYFFAAQVSRRKWGFFLSIAFALLFVLANLCAAQQRREVCSKRGAIVTAPTVSVRNTPSATSETKFVIHEGTRVEIKDRSMKGWYAVSIADGREGWLTEKQVEEI